MSEEGSEVSAQLKAQPTPGRMCEKNGSVRRAVFRRDALGRYKGQVGVNVLWVMCATSQMLK